MVKTKVSDRNVVPGSTKYVDTGTCLGKITVTKKASFETTLGGNDQKIAFLFHTSMD